eukprot:m.10573 g.10573  ORF g.10573 m.10573 type:complete len:1495 (+) comp3816_c1_seq1:325-4809(+)
MGPLLGVDKAVLVQTLATPPNQRVVEDVDCIFTVLQDLPPLLGWSHRALRDLSSACWVVQLAKGTTVPSGGEAFFTVLDGNVLLDQQQLLHPGTCFAFNMLAELTPASTVLCLEDAALLVVNADKFVHWTQDGRAFLPTLDKSLDVSADLADNSELVAEISAMFQDLDSIILDGDKAPNGRPGDDRRHADDNSDADEEDGAFSPLPSPPPRPRIPYHSLVEGDIIYDDDCGQFVSSPAAGLFKATDSFDEDPGVVLFGDTREGEDMGDDAMHRGDWDLQPPSDPVREALEKRPVDRTPNDVKALAREMKRFTFFADQPESVREHICEALEFEEFTEPGTVIHPAGKSMQDWHIVLSGACLIAKPNYESAAELPEGAVFGAATPKCSSELTVTSTTRRCQVARVNLKVYEEALHRGEKNTLTTKEGGKAVCVRERRESKSGIVSTVIVRAAAEQLYACLIGNESENDVTFEEDMLMTYRTFSTAQQFLAHLQRAVHDVHTRPRAAKVLISWCDKFFSDFASAAMQGQLAEIERQLQELASSDVYALALRQDCARLADIRQREAKPRELQFGVSEAKLGFELLDGPMADQGIIVNNVVTGSKADKAGLRAGDEILCANGVDFGEGHGVDKTAALRTLRQSTQVILRVRPKTISHGRRSESRTSLSKPSADKHVKSGDASPSGTRRKSGVGSLGRYMDKHLKRLFKGGKGDLSGLPALERLQIEYDPAEHDVIRVYCSDQSFKHLAVAPDTTAREVVDMMCAILSLPDPNKHALCEVSVVHGGLVKQTTLRDPTDNLVQALRPSGRYYIKSTVSAGSLLPDDAKTELQVESSNDDLILKVDAIEMAREITATDYKLFAAIGDLEYLAFLWRQENDEETRENLQRFTDRFNHICGWVVTEVCRQKALRRRADTIKQFVKVARYCHHCQNFNSLFAIISGLGSPAVSRLKQTWERLSGKYQDTFNELESLMDPSRNMARYRNMLQHAVEQPPLVPFFPLLMKDLAFMHEGNKSKIDGLVNFDKLRMIAGEIRQVRHIRQHAYAVGTMFGQKEKRDMSMKVGWSRTRARRHIQHYLGSVQAVLDSKQQMQMSYSCEPSNRRVSVSPRASALLQSRTSSPPANTSVSLSSSQPDAQSTPVKATPTTTHAPPALIVTKPESADDQPLAASERRPSFTAQGSIPDFALEAPPDAMPLDNSDAETETDEPDFVGAPPPPAPSETGAPSDVADLADLAAANLPAPITSVTSAMEVEDDIIDHSRPPARESFVDDDTDEDEDETDNVTSVASPTHDSSAVVPMVVVVPPLDDAESTAPPKQPAKSQAPADEADAEEDEMSVAIMGAAPLTASDTSDQVHAEGVGAAVEALISEVASVASESDETMAATQGPANTGQATTLDGQLQEEPGAAPGRLDAVDALLAQLTLAPPGESTTDFALDDDLLSLVVPPPPSDLDASTDALPEQQALLPYDLSSMMVPPPSGSLPGSPAQTRKPSHDHSTPEGDN